jgi:hypothetical protein
MASILQTVLQKEMDRREFLVHIGAGLMAVTGVGTLAKALLSEPEILHLATSVPQAQHGQAAQTKRKGYGGGPYGP